MKLILLLYVFLSLLIQPVSQANTAPPIAPSATQLTHSSNLKSPDRPISPREDGITAKGNQSNWGWAHAIAELLQHKGKKVSAEDVIRSLFRGAMPQIRGNNKLVGQALEKFGVAASIFPKAMSKQDFMEYLNASSTGVLVGLPGKLVVVQGVDAQGKLIVSDPNVEGEEEGKGQTQSLSYEELFNQGWHSTVLLDRDSPTVPEGKSPLLSKAGLTPSPEPPTRKVASTNPAREDGIACQGRTPWCWAYTVAELLQHQGVRASGVDVVRSVFGGRLIRTGGVPPMMLRAMQKYGQEGHYRPGVFYRSTLTKYLNKANSGLIMFVPGHVMVLQKVTSDGHFILANSGTRGPDGRGRVMKVSYEQLRRMGWHGTIYLDHETLREASPVLN